MKLYAARHGETTWNVENRILGNTPGTLTAKGRAQAEALAEAVAKLNLHKAYASDLARVKETVVAIEKSVPSLEVAYTERLRERNFGQLEGKLMSEIDWDGFWALPPDEVYYEAESLTAFTERIARFITELAVHDQTEAIGVFSHIGVMNRLNYLTDPDHFSFVHYSNADVVEFDFATLLQNSHTLLQN